MLGGIKAPYHHAQLLLPLETTYCYAAQDVLEIAILLPQTSDCWDYRYKLLWQGQKYLLEMMKILHSYGDAYTIQS